MGLIPSLWGFLLDFGAPLILRFSLRMLLDSGSWAPASISSVFPGRLGELTLHITGKFAYLTMAEMVSLRVLVFWHGVSGSTMAFYHHFHRAERHAVQSAPKGSRSMFCPVGVLKKLTLPPSWYCKFYIVMTISWLDIPSFMSPCSYRGAQLGSPQSLSSPSASKAAIEPSQLPLVDYSVIVRRSRPVNFWSPA